MDLAFQLKGKLFTMSVLQILSTDISKIEQQLNQKVKLAPQFFNNTPVIIDFHEIDNEFMGFDIVEFKQVLEKHTIIPVGFRSGSEEVRNTIKELKLPLMIEARATAQSQSIKQSNKPKNQTQAQEKLITETKSIKTTVTIKQQVRSGQQIYAPDGDLIILASVSPGAELLAEGNIHVYGTLKGRALAGLNGDTEAMIFCSKLEADLVSIAGQYRLFEENLAESEQSEGSTQIYLRNGQIVIATL